MQYASIPLHKYLYNNTVCLVSTPKKLESSIVSVDVNRILYNKISKKADERNASIRRFVNELLKAVFNKYEFLDQAFPELRLDGIGEKSLYIKDFSNKKQDVTAEVKLKEAFKPWCSLCNTDTCKHVHYAEILPDIGHIMSFQASNVGNNKEQSIGRDRKT